MKVPFKASVEIAGIRISDPAGDFSHPEVRGSKQKLCFEHTDLVDILNGRLTGYGLEQPAEMRKIEIAAPGQLGQIDFFVVMIVYIRKRISQFVEFLRRS